MKIYSKRQIRMGEYIGEFQERESETLKKEPNKISEMKNTISEKLTVSL